MPNNLEAFIVRLPSHLHAKIKATAKADRRSMNNEIVERLEISFAKSQDSTSDIKIKELLLDRIAFLERQIELMQVELKAHK